MFIAAIAIVSGAIIIPLQLTGQLNGPACPAGQQLVLIPSGKVMIPECLK